MMVGLHRGGGRERHGALARASVVYRQRGGARAGRDFGRSHSLHRRRRRYTAREHYLFYCGWQPGWIVLY